MLVTGFAQVPKGTTLHEVYKTVAVVLIINTKTEQIVNAQLTFLTDVMNNYIRDLLIGYDLREGIKPLLDKVRRHCLVPTQGAIIQAIRSAWDRYQESKPFTIE